MQTHGKWSWAAIIAPPLLALGVATLMACAESTSPRERGGGLALLDQHPEDGTQSFNIRDAQGRLHEMRMIHRTTAANERFVSIVSDGRLILEMREQWIATAHGWRLDKRAVTGYAANGYAVRWSSDDGPVTPPTTFQPPTVSLDGMDVEFAGGCLSKALKVLGLALVADAAVAAAVAAPNPATLLAAIAAIAALSVAYDDYIDCLVAAQ